MVKRFGLHHGNSTLTRRDHDQREPGQREPSQREPSQSMARRFVFDYESHVVLLVVLLVAALLTPGEFRSLRAQEAASSVRRVREIFVPFEDLNILLEGQTQRIFLTREEYEQLLARVKKQPETPKSPVAVAVVAADYQTVVEEGRAIIRARLTLEVMADGIQQLPLEIADVGIRSAILDGKPASLTAGPPMMLFVEGRGRKQLEFELIAPMQTAAALQTLHCDLPVPPVATMSLTVNGNVELKSGADVLSRVIDADKGVTRFQLLMRRGPQTLVMTLNNRQLLKDRVVVARSVLVDEVTQAYERLHATMSFAVLHGSVNQVRVRVPDGFDVNEVRTELLSKWNLVKAEEGQILEVSLREATSSPVVLQISAARIPPKLDDWFLPDFKPLDVAGHVAVVGLLVEERLQSYAMESRSLIPMQTAYLTENLPESVFRAEPGAPLIRPVVAYYAPQGEVDLRAKFRVRPSKLSVTTNSLLILSNTRQDLRGLFVVKSEVEKLFAFDFNVPIGWHLTSVYGKDNQPLSFEVFRTADGGRARVVIPQGAPADTPYEIRFQAVSTPEKWLGDWTQIGAMLPVFAAIGADKDEGAVGVTSVDDLNVLADEVQGLVPLDDVEKPRYGMAGVETDLVYRYDSPNYSAKLRVERAKPTVTARTYSFARIEPDDWHLRHELIYDIQDAGTDRLALLLPVDTPSTLSIRGLDNAIVKEFSATEVEQSGQRWRRWDVLLAQRMQGNVRIAADYTTSSRDTVPVVLAEGVAYQTSIVAVEGHAELDAEVMVEKDSQTRKVDIGELAAAEYQVGKRVLAAYEFVGSAAEMRVAMRRRSALELPTAIVQRAELVSLLGANGVCQTAARFHLRTKAMYLEVELPEGAELWSIYLDRQPTTPQQEGNRLLVSVPARAESDLRDLQIVYQVPVERLLVRGNVQAAAPSLRLREGESADAIEVPLADLKWLVRLPSGYQMVKSSGTIFPDFEDATTRDQLALRRSPWETLASAGAVMVNEATLSTINASRELRRDNAFGRVAKAARGLADMPPPMAAPMEAPMAAAKSGEAVEALEFGQREGGERPPGSPMLAEAKEARDRNAIRDLDGDLAAAPAKPGASGAPGRLPVANDPGNAVAEQDSSISGGLSLSGKDLGGMGGGMGGMGGRGSMPPQIGGADFDFDTSTGKSVAWALEGVRSLEFNLPEFQSRGGEWIAFRSFGADPQLSAVVIDRRRLRWLGWLLASVVAFCSISRWRSRTSSKSRWVIGLLLASTIVPLVSPWVQELAILSDFVFWAAFGSGIFFVLLGAVRLIVNVVTRWWRVLLRTSVSATTTAAMIACMLQMTPALLQAQPGPEAGGPPVANAPPTGISPEQLTGEIGKILAPLFGPSPPVKVPDDAILIPYNPNDPEGVKKSERILVPLEKYQELLNLANPREQRLVPPTHFAWANAAYQATLVDQGFLEVRGRLLLNLFTDDEVSVPMELAGGILIDARVDGQAARVRLVATQPAKGEAPQPLSVLSVSGKGQKTIDIAVRFATTRSGGWRAVTGRLPGTAVAAFAVTIPEAKTEVRLAGLPDRNRFESEAANEKLETALTPGGPFTIQWRPKVSEAEVDRSLTAKSQAELEVREDALRLLWQLQLEFPRSRRDAFSIAVPRDYLVERVTGANVQGWSMLDGANNKESRLEVTLLKAAQDKEQILLQLSRRDWYQRGKEGVISLPVVTPVDAVQHQGTLLLRRSPILELKLAKSMRLTQTDLPESLARGEDALSQGVLVARPFQAFRFASADYQGEVAVREIEGQQTAEFRTIVRVSERETRLESQIVMETRDRPVFRVDLALPKTMKLERVVAPGVFEWGVTEEAERNLATIHLTGGMQGKFSLNIEGSLGNRNPNDPVPLAAIEVVGVQRQTGDMVVQADPAYDVIADDADLKGIQVVTLDKTYAWLAAEQRATKRLALQFSKPGYQGTLKVARRKAEVACLTVSNILISGRTIRETALLQYEIQNSGIREVTFQLPASLRSARIKTALMRRKTIEEVDADWVRVRVELQDEVIGTLKVLVEHDRLVSGEKHQATVPIVEKVDRIDQQLVALESSGRDEVIFDEAVNLREVSDRGSSALASLLGSNFLVAYEVTGANPRLTYHLQARRTVETVGARIGFGLTELRLDGAGAYRAKVTYYVENSIEQFLVARLPEGASLWAVKVDGEPVKPSPVDSSGSGNQVRIPLVKTALGDPPYPVTLTYAGRMPMLETVSSIQFPLVRTMNINAQLSHVRLLLSATHRWGNFGGTLGQVQDKAEFQAGFLEFRSQQAEQLVALLQSDIDSLTRLRCENNLQQLGLSVDQYTFGNARYSANRVFQERAAGIRAAQSRAAQQISELSQKQAAVATEIDNRQRFNDFVVQNPSLDRARNVVGKLGRNFDGVQGQEESAGEINKFWFQSNSLSRKADGEDASKKASKAEAKGDDNQKQVDKMLESKDGKDSKERSKSVELPQSRVTQQAGKKTAGDFAERSRVESNSPAQLYDDSLQKEQLELRNNLGQNLDANRSRRQSRATDQNAIEERYQRRLQNQSQQALNFNEQALTPGQQPADSPAAGAPPGSGAGSGQGLGFRGGSNNGMPQGPQGGQQAGQGQSLADEKEAVQSMDESFGVDRDANAYLRSLDVELADRGQEFLFRTAGGELELTAQALDGNIAQRGIRLGAVLAGIVGLSLAAAFTRAVRNRFAA